MARIITLKNGQQARVDRKGNILAYIDANGNELTREQYLNDIRSSNRTRGDYSQHSTRLRRTSPVENNRINEPSAKLDDIIVNNKDKTSLERSNIKNNSTPTINTSVSTRTLTPKTASKASTKSSTANKPKKNNTKVDDKQSKLSKVVNPNPNSPTTANAQRSQLLESMKDSVQQLQDTINTAKQNTNKSSQNSTKVNSNSLGSTINKIDDTINNVKNTGTSANKQELLNTLMSTLNIIKQLSKNNKSYPSISDKIHNVSKNIKSENQAIHDRRNALRNVDNNTIAKLRKQGYTPEQVREKLGIK